MDQNAIGCKSARCTVPCSAMRTRSRTFAHSSHDRSHLDKTSRAREYHPHRNASTNFFLKSKIYIWVSIVEEEYSTVPDPIASTPSVDREYDCIPFQLFRVECHRRSACPIFARCACQCSANFGVSTLHFHTIRNTSVMRKVKSFFRSMDKLAPIIISNSAIASSLLDSTANTPICDLMESVFGAIDAPLPVAYAANLLCRQMPPQMPKELSVRPFGIPLPSPVPLSHWHKIECKCTEHSNGEKK